MTKSSKYIVNSDMLNISPMTPIASKVIYPPISRRKLLILIGDLKNQRNDNILFTLMEMISQGSLDYITFNGIEIE